MHHRGDQHGVFYQDHPRWLFPIHLSGPRRQNSNQQTAAPTASSSNGQPSATKPPRWPRTQPSQQSGGPSTPTQGWGPQEERGYYGPAQANAEASRLPFVCDGCGRIGLRAPECRFKRHRSWNHQWANVPFRRSPIGLAIQKVAEGTGFNSLPASVEWDEVSGTWVESEVLNAWRRSIRESRYATATNQPRSSGGPCNSWGAPMPINPLLWLPNQFIGVGQATLPAALIRSLLPVISLYI
jgi:hypothetical protein